MFSIGIGRRDHTDEEGGRHRGGKREEAERRFLASPGGGLFRSRRKKIQGRWNGEERGARIPGGLTSESGYVISNVRMGPKKSASQQKPGRGGGRGVLAAAHLNGAVGRRGALNCRDSAATRTSLP